MNPDPGANLRANFCIVVAGQRPPTGPVEPSRVYWAGYTARVGCPLIISAAWKVPVRRAWQETPPWNVLRRLRAESATKERVEDVTHPVIM